MTHFFVVGTHVYISSFQFMCMFKRVAYNIMILDVFMISFNLFHILIYILSPVLYQYSFESFMFSCFFP